MPEEQPSESVSEKPAGAGEGAREFEEAGENVGLARELVELILHNKKWWLVPVIVVLLVIGLLVVLGSTALAPYLYPLF